MSTYELKNKSEADKLSTGLVKAGDESAILKVGGEAKAAEAGIAEIQAFAAEAKRVADEKAVEVEDMKSGRRDNSTGTTIAKLKTAVANLGGADAQRLLGLIDSMEAGGVSADEMVEIIQKTVILLVGSLDAFGDDISNAHQKIAYNKSRLTGVASTVSKLSKLVTNQLTRINATLVARGLDPQPALMDNIKHGALYFGDNNHRRLDIVTWLMSMVTTKAMRLYAPVPDQEWYKTIFVRNNEPVYICVGLHNQALNQMDKVPEHYRFVELASGRVLNGGDEIRGKGTMFMMMTTPYIAPSMGAFAKVLLAGWLSGRFESPLGLLAAFATQSIGNFADGGKAGDLDLGL